MASGWIRRVHLQVKRWRLRELHHQADHLPVPPRLVELGQPKSSVVGQGRDRASAHGQGPPRADSPLRQPSHGPYKETNPVVYHGACISKYDDFGVQVKKEVPGNYDAPLRLSDGKPNPASRPLTRITDDDVAADGFNASVRPMTTSHNSMAGRDLWLFYALYRVNRTSKFWVSLKDQPPR